MLIPIVPDMRGGAIIVGYKHIMRGAGIGWATSCQGLLKSHFKWWLHWVVDP